MVNVCKGIAIFVAVVAAWQIATALGISTLGIVLTCAAGCGAIYFGSKLVKKFKLKKESKVNGEDKLEEEKLNEKLFSKIKNKVKGIFKPKKRLVENENIKSDEDEKKVQGKNDVNYEVLKFETVNSQQAESPSKTNFENNRCEINQYRNAHYKDDYDFRQQYQYKGVKKDKNVAFITDYDRRMNLIFKDVCMVYLSVVNNHQVMIILKKDGSTDIIDDSRLFENIFASLVANEKDERYSKMTKTEMLSELSKQGLYRFVPYNMIYQIKQKLRGKFVFTYCNGDSVSINEEKLDEYLSIMCRDYQMDEMQLSDCRLYTKIAQKTRVRK